ncbi:tRNA (adenosine(37)-N6)-threonylcarbamoyltransferase complex ATPase subunit type 1 TsaE [Telmatocola sphagniphila]|uniref:tRNA threonylcarbamoyladenosine biosynthesis protein TsaE n=2 Tax=Telmatocola sphagniphila TaxID=1123043 RepID=A0A8E6B9Q6_9BACT|nr:tRNA (adenosine(37)-N6)-threonylcarbamoyltransferase complex ATPase subunit type 1 TsaE [Telmatocola sphagniphila]
MDQPKTSFSFAIANLEQTERLGRWLGSRLFPNSVVALLGQLGAGKTHLSRAIAQGLEISNERLVTSPTFVLIQEYPARLPIFHFDAYRLANPQAFRDLGVDEYYSGGGVCLIEWADRIVPALPEQYLEIRLEIVQQDVRLCQVTAIGELYRKIVENLRLDWSDGPEAS